MALQISERETIFLVNDAEIIGQPFETWHLSLSSHNVQFQVDYRTKCEGKTIKQHLENNKGAYIHDLDIGEDCLNRAQKALNHKGKDQ